MDTMCIVVKLSLLTEPRVLTVSSTIYSNIHNNIYTAPSLRVVASFCQEGAEVGNCGLFCQWVGGGGEVRKLEPFCNTIQGNI